MLPPHEYVKNKILHFVTLPSVEGGNSYCGSYSRQKHLMLFTAEAGISGPASRSISVMFDPEAVNTVQFCPGVRDSLPVDINIHRGFLPFLGGERHLRFSSVVELFFCSHPYSFLCLYFIGKIIVVLSCRAMCMDWLLEPPFPQCPPL